jgi:hypothetical protein
MKTLLVIIICLGGLLFCGCAKKKIYTFDVVIDDTNYGYHCFYTGYNIIEVRKRVLQDIQDKHYHLEGQYVFLSNMTMKDIKSIE